MQYLLLIYQNETAPAPRLCGARCARRRFAWDGW